MGRHRELGKAEVKMGEESVQRPRAVRNFTNYYTLTYEQALLPGFWCSPPQGSRDGHATFDPIKKKKLKTTENCKKKVAFTTSQGK